VAHHVVLSARETVAFQPYCPKSGRDSKSVTTSRRAALRIGVSSLFNFCCPWGMLLGGFGLAGRVLRILAIPETIRILLRTPNPGSASGGLSV
jgi:hypothetical protein